MTEQVLGRRAGQATAEYVLVAFAIVIALATIEVVGRTRCVANLAGDLSHDECSSLVQAVGESLRRSVEEITFLINLPL